MMADQNFYDLRFTVFILWLRLWSTAKGRSFSGPNIRLRPKVKKVPTVQHWRYKAIILILRLCAPILLIPFKIKVLFIWTDPYLLDLAHIDAHALDSAYKEIQ